MSLDIVDRRLLNLVQAEFPLHPEPFAALGSRLGVGEDKVLMRLHRFKKSGLIRCINAIFNSTQLGYHGTLVAMHLGGEQVEPAAALVNRHTGVSHNYLRDHYFNLWFTLTATKDTGLEAIVSKLGERTGAALTLSLPARRVFKIILYLDMLGDGDWPDSGVISGLTRETADDLSDGDRALVRELQEDLPLVRLPFDEMATRLGLEVDELLDRTAGLRERGVMRRYGARLNHRRAGFVVNAMSCWVVAPESIDQVGQAIAGHRQVSHCYERQTAPQWPYNLYAVIHSHTEEESRSIARLISEETGIENYVLLHSAKEYLKRSLRYFTE